MLKGMPLKAVVGFGLVTVLVLWVMDGQADEGAAEGASVPPDVTGVTQAITRPILKSKGKYAREKDTEGTKAANRFEAKNVIESRYKLNGESLEVDPD